MRLLRPVKRSYIVTFSYSEHVAYAIEHNLGNSYRPGIDYVGYHANNSGDIPIYCAYKGTVDKIIYDEKGYGNCIKVKHDWGYSLYAHLKYRPELSIGAFIDEFTIVGYQGHTGNCRDAYGNNTEDASHLHFETRDLNNINFDPTKYIVDRESYITEDGNKDNDIHVGSIVYIKNGAKSYDGRDLWVGVYGNQYVVDEIYNDRILLDKDGICTPINIKDVYLSNQQNPPITSNKDDENKSDYYIVQSGDSLWSISQKFDTTINNLLKLNPQITNPSLIYVGQKIKIK